MKNTLLSIAVAFAASVSGIALAAAEEVDVTFVLVNDIDKADREAERGGFARLNAVVKSERESKENVVYVHAGDMISPSLMSGFDKGEHTIELVNLVPPDIYVPGNHEYDFGEDVFRQRMSEAKFEILAANLSAADGQPIGKIGSSTMLDKGGVKIGVVGLTADDAPVKSSPGDNLKFASALEVGSAEAEKLREQGADFVVAVSHSNRATDRALFESRAFDLILSGDDHDLMLLYDGRTIMAESLEQGDYVTAIDVSFDVEEADGKREVDWFPNFRIIDTATVTPDPETQTMLDAVKAELSRELDVSLGTSAVALDSRRASVRTEETVIGNLIADAMRQATDADVAITNGGGIRGNKEYAAGAPILRRDILSELPFGNTTVKLEVTGDVIKQALENGVGDVENAAGRFPQVSGLTFAYDPSAAPGSRVTEVMIGGAPLDPAKTYVLATNDFMANGGDGYAMFKEGKVLVNGRDGNLMANDVMAYIREAGGVQTKIENRISRAQ